MGFVLIPLSKKAEHLLEHLNLGRDLGMKVDYQGLKSRYVPANVPLIMFHSSVECSVNVPHSCKIFSRYSTLNKCEKGRIMYFFKLFLANGTLEHLYLNTATQRVIRGIRELYIFSNTPKSSNTRKCINAIFHRMFQKEVCPMARTTKITIDDVEYTLQSVTFSWYSNLTDLYINPANGRKNTAKYADSLIKGCVTAPAEVAKKGIAFFDERDDLATPGELVRAIESFLSERNKS